MRTRLLPALVVLLVTGMLAPAALAAPGGAPGPAAGPREGTIPGRYIVTLVDGADPAAVARDYRARGADVDHVYRRSLRGFAGAFPPGLVDRLGADDRVVRVEADGWVHTAELASQTGATWGLDRVDERERVLDGVYRYATTATGVTAYVLDTGIRATHAEFNGRVVAGYTSIADGRGTDDCNGHGTHVAGTIGGGTYGVAKGVTLVPVRVLGCDGSGTWSGVIAGIDWVTGHATGPAVANMSLSGGANSSVDDAVRRSIADGVAYALAAGNNSGSDACRRSPARVSEGLTVGATTSTDTRASYSNIGRCLDLFAPGSSITSAGVGHDTDVATMSGTSMATPHVAGVAALWLASHAGASVAAVNDAVVANATAGLVVDEGRDSPDLLLHSLWLPPAAPADLTATAVSSSRIDLAWSDVVGEDGYELVVDGAATPIALPAGTTAWSHDGLAASSAHTYVLTAVNDGGSSDPVTVSATTLAEGEVPPAPPTASFTYDCAGSATCAFDGSPSTDGVGYAWSFGATTELASHTFTGPGSYDVTLTVTDAEGRTGSDTRTVSCAWSGKGKWKRLECA